MQMQVQMQMQMQMQVQVPSQPATPDQPTREKYRRSTNRKSQKKGSDPVRARPESLLNISSIFSFSCRSFFSSSLSLSSFPFLKIAFLVYALICELPEGGVRGG
jgi:hypothetical protein